MTLADADAADRACCCCWRCSCSSPGRARSSSAVTRTAARRHPRPDGHRQERARHRARHAVRRRSRELRLDGRLSRLRHRDRQGAAGRARRHPASPDRRRRSARGVLRGALRARGGGGHPRHHGPRPAADSRRRHRPLLSRADARLLPGPGPRQRRCARGSSASPTGAGPSACTAGCSGWIRHRRCAFRAAIGSGSIRALEVYLSDRPAADRRISPTPRRRCPTTTISAFALQIPAEATAERVARRVDAQFRAGAAGRGARAAGVGRSRDRPSVHGARLPAGARAARRACATRRRRAS